MAAQQENRRFEAPTGEKMRVMKRLLASLSAAPLSLAAVAAHAAGTAPLETKPEPWQVQLQPAATDIMHQIRWFADYTMWFVVPIVALVLLLIAWCIWRFRESVHPVPSRTSHNTLIEVIWTIGPVIVLLFIAVPSFQLLTAQYTPPDRPG